MSDTAEIERRQYARRQCDQHDLCVQKIESRLDSIDRKINTLCKRSETHVLTADRVRDLEHRIASHDEKIGDELRWRDGHERFKDDAQKEQRLKDEAMQNDITGLKLAVSELTTTIVETKSDLKEYFRRPLIAGAIAAVVTCVSALGVLFMFVMQMIAKSKGLV